MLRTTSECMMDEQLSEIHLVQSTVGVAINFGAVFKVWSDWQPEYLLMSQYGPVGYLFYIWWWKGRRQTALKGGKTVIDNSCLITSTPTRRSTRQGDLTRRLLHTYSTDSGRPGRTRGPAKTASTHLRCLSIVVTSQPRLALWMGIEKHVEDAGTVSQAEQQHGVNSAGISLLMTEKNARGSPLLFRPVPFGWTMPQEV